MFFLSIATADLLGHELGRRISASDITIRYLTSDKDFATRFFNALHLRILHGVYGPPRARDEKEKVIGMIKHCANPDTASRPPLFPTLTTKTRGRERIAEPPR